MDEIERVIRLTQSFEKVDAIILEMRYSFSSMALCQAFFDELSNSSAANSNAANIQQLVAPKIQGDEAVAGLRVEAPLDKDTLRGLCHHYRDQAARHQGIALKWGVRLKR